MRKGREVIGLPVVSLTTGKELGLVEDLIWDHQGEKVTHLVVNSRALPLPEIASIGEDAVTVDRDTLPEGRVAPQVSRASGLKGLPVLSAGGNNVGTIEDVIFEKEDGKLLGYEMSSGLVRDLVTGRGILAPELVLTLGKEAVIVKDALDTKGEM